MGVGLLAGLGHAASGFMNGYSEGQRLNLQREQEQRDKDRAIREKEAHTSTMDTQKQQREATGLQMQQTTMQIEQAKRDEEANKNFESQANNLKNMRLGGYEGELLDQNGQSLGMRKVYGDPATAEAELAKQGYQVRPETLKKLAPIDDDTFKKGMALAIVNHSIATRKASVDDLDKLTSFNKKMEDEGVHKGLDYFKRTGDKEGMFKIFDAQGEHKSDQFKDIEFKVVKDDLGGQNVVGYRIDPKTKKPIQVFDEFADVTLHSLSPEGRAAIINSNKQLATKEYGDTYRNERTNATHLAVQGMKDNGDKNTADKQLLVERYKALHSAANNDITAALRNPMGAMDMQRTMAIENEVTAQAEQYMHQGADVGKARAAARAYVYQKRGIKLPAQQ
jgi:hypothetical protein